MILREFTLIMLQYGSYYLVHILTKLDEGAYRRLFLGVVHG